MSAKNNVLLFRPKVQKPTHFQSWDFANLLGLKDGCRIFKMTRSNEFFPLEKGDLVIADFSEKPKDSEPGVFVFADRVDVIPFCVGTNARALIDFGKIIAVIKLVV